MRWSAPFQFVNSVKPPVTILVKGISWLYFTEFHGSFPSTRIYNSTISPQTSSNAKPEQKGYSKSKRFWYQIIKTLNWTRPSHTSSKSFCQPSSWLSGQSIPSPPEGHQKGLFVKSAWWQNSRLNSDRNRVLPTCLKGTFTSPSMLGSSRNVFQHSWNSIGRGISLERALNGLWCRDRVVQVRYAVRYPRSDQQSSTNPCTLKLSNLSLTMPGLPKTHQSLGMLGNYPRHQWLYLPTLTPPNRAGPHGKRHSQSSHLSPFTPLQAKSEQVALPATENARYKPTVVRPISAPPVPYKIQTNPKWQLSILPESKRHKTSPINIPKLLPPSIRTAGKAFKAEGQTALAAWHQCHCYRAEKLLSISSNKTSQWTRSVRQSTTKTHLINPAQSIPPLKSHKQMFDQKQQQSPAGVGTSAACLHQRKENTQHNRWKSIQHHNLRRLKTGGEARISSNMLQSRWNRTMARSNTHLT